MSEPIVLRSRVLTALVLLPLVLGSVFGLPTPWFAAVVGIAVLVGAWEWARLIGIDRRSSRWAYLALVVFLLSVFGSVVNAGVLIPAVLAIGVIWWLIALAVLIRCNAVAASATPLAPGIGSVVGLLLLVPAWTGLVWLHARPEGPWLVMLVLVITWAADVGAYFAGRSLGRFKLAPRISPGKTWEGAVGGLLLATAAGYGMQAIVPAPTLNMPLYGLLVAVTVVFSIVGDLFESLVKRRAGVKDSGTLLPGHGGVLDRIDSLTATATVFAAGLYWL
ncbi:MAG: phosphatidate cytidylyltransferase [Aquisalimonadaceae bacterium]